MKYATLIAATLLTVSGLALADTSRDDVEPALQSSHASPLTRAEVQADLHLWRAAGLDAGDGDVAQDTLSAEYQAKVATYQRLRQGPAFLAELRRILGQSAVAEKPAQGQPG